MILLVAFFNKKVTFTAVLLNWLLVYLGNMASCFFCSYVFGYVTQIFISPIYQDYLVGVANLKTSLPWYIIFLRAIPANALVCLSIFLGLAARDVMGKLAGLWIPIFCFAAIGYEHCIGLCFARAGEQPSGERGLTSVYSQHDVHYSWSLLQPPWSDRHLGWVLVQPKCGAARQRDRGRAHHRR